MGTALAFGVGATLAVRVRTAFATAVMPAADAVFLGNGALETDVLDLAAVEAAHLAEDLAEDLGDLLEDVDELGKQRRNLADGVGQLLQQLADLLAPLGDRGRCLRDHDRRAEAQRE